MGKGLFVRYCPACNNIWRVSAYEKRCPTCREPSLVKFVDPFSQPVEGDDEPTLEVEGAPCQWPGCTQEAEFRCQASEGCFRSYCYTHYTGQNELLRQYHHEIPIVCWVCRNPLRRFRVWLEAYLSYALRRFDSAPRTAGKKKAD